MQYNHSYLLLCLFLGSQACAEAPAPASVSPKGAPQVSQAIVHGRQATQGESLDAVAKLIFVQENTMCSGTLIAPDTVLTAAHCLPQAWGLSGGVERLSEAQRIAVTLHGEHTAIRFAHAAAIHPSYRGLLRCAHPLGEAEHKACMRFVRQCGNLDRDAQEECLSTLDKPSRRALGVDRLWPTPTLPWSFWMRLCRILCRHAWSTIIAAAA